MSSLVIPFNMKNLFFCSILLEIFWSGNIYKKEQNFLISKNYNKDVIFVISHQGKSFIGLPQKKPVKKKPEKKVTKCHHEEKKSFIA